MATPSAVKHLGMGAQIEEVAVQDLAWKPVLGMSAGRDDESFALGVLDPQLPSSEWPVDAGSEGGPHIS